MSDMISPIAGAAGGIISGIGGLVQGQQNLDLQKQNLEYQKGLQQQIFSREDNAVQRRAADMEAAGLSRTLAAGSGASAGTAISTTAPQRSGTRESLKELSNVPEKALAIKQASASIETTKNQNKLLLAQANKVQKETELIGGKKNLQDVDLMYAEAFNERKLNILASEVQHKKNQVEIQELDKQSKRLGITQANLNLVITELNQKKATQDLTLGEKKIIAQQLLIEISDVKLRSDTFNQEWYLDKQMPSDANPGINSSASVQLQNMLSGLADKFKK